MRTPEIVTIEVVGTGNAKHFRLPDGSLVSEVLAGAYGSWKPRSDGGVVVSFDKEVDTPFVVFRDGEYYDRGTCEYIFGSDGYHVVEGIPRIDKGTDHRTFMHARWFRTGEVISFIRTPSTHELKQRTLQRA